jgi:putative acetyltransferase
VNDLTLRPAGLDEPDILELIGLLNRELDQRYPEEGANHFRLDPEEIAPGRGLLLVALRGGRAVGCGAVRLNDVTTAEIKRMYVRESERGRGVARAVLAGLEQEARRLGARQLVLETGERQFESVALYRRAGFREIPRFGEYVATPLSLCMGKQLD